ncbi:MAG: hypothetical protein R2690_09410 [Acidimicrobiales bacterium]
MSDLPAEVVDVVPTIADVAGIPPRGRSTASPRDAEAAGFTAPSIRCSGIGWRRRRRRAPSSSADGFEARARNAALLASGADEVALGSLPGSPGLGRSRVDDLAVCAGRQRHGVRRGRVVRTSSSDDAPIPAFVEVQLIEVAVGRWRWRWTVVVSAGATTPDGLLWGYLPIERSRRAPIGSTCTRWSQGATEPTLHLGGVAMSGDDAGTSAVAGERPRADRWPWVADRRGRAIELFTMCGLAIAQPVFAVVGSNVAELAARRAGALRGDRARPRVASRRRCSTPSRQASPPGVPPCCGSLHPPCSACSSGRSCSS